MFDILKNAKKAELALELLELEEDPWPVSTPIYIREGLSMAQSSKRSESNKSNRFRQNQALLR